MELVCPTSLSRCRPFRRGSGGSETGPRIGGRAPEGIIPSYGCTNAMHLFTFPLLSDGQKEVTVFYSRRAFDEMVSVPCNSIELTLGRFIDVAVHGPSRRSANQDFSSDLSEHPLVFLGETDDVFSDDDSRESPLFGHKTGGRPYRLGNRNELFDRIEGLQKEDYLLIAQMEFMVNGDAQWKGNWPFADGIFHVFGRSPFTQHDWFWVWHF
jgi:hypothetical protein